MKVMIALVTYWLKINIIYPIKAWWNFYIKHDWITDNMRNRALMEYCKKVMSDFSYQPEGPYEVFFENKLKETYDNVIEYLKSINEDENINWDCVSYEKERPFCAAQIYENLLQKPWVKE